MYMNMAGNCNLKRTYLYRIFYLEKKQIFVINDTVKSETSEFFKIAKTLVLAGLEGCNLIKNGLLPAGIEKNHRDPKEKLYTGAWIIQTPDSPKCYYKECMDDCNEIICVDNRS